MRGQAFNSRLVLMIKIVLGLILTAGRATFSGRISPQDTQVQQTDVKYSFLLNFSKTIPADGRLVIRFPSEYTERFSVSSFDLQSGFTSSSSQSFQYQSTSRMLTLTGAFPTTGRQILFQVTGITNPGSTKQTGSFYISSYSWGGSAGYVLIETGGQYIDITPTPGSISSAALTLSSLVLGSQSILQIQLTPEHSLPKTGKIQLLMPKWNYEDPILQDQESMIAVATSPCSVECLPQLGLLSQTTSCELTKGTQTDLLEISLDEQSDVVPNMKISMLIQGVRAPPSQTPTTGFQLQTTDESGYSIDTVTPASDISLSATIPFVGSAQSASVTADPMTVGMTSNLTIIAQNALPMVAGCQVRIELPEALTFTQEPVRVWTSGVSLNPSPQVSVSSPTHSITIKNLNSSYLQALSQSHFYVYGLKNPGSTETTSSFKIEFLDANGAYLESITQGITLQAQVNSFASVALQTSDTQINLRDVKFEFTLVGKDSFSNAAILKLTFPNELWVAPGAYVDSISGNLVKGADTTISYNHIVEVSYAFSEGYTAGDLIQFSVSGVTNPMTTQTTDGIKVKIYYQEFISEISAYEGDLLSFTATPSDQISVTVGLENQNTGMVQENFKVSGQTPVNMPIAKGSILRFFIPPQFLISDASRVAASCTATGGFSDEILCSWQSVDQRAGAYLIVQNGFDSKVFPGGQFNFTLAEIKNPFTTAETDAFGLQVYDKSGNPIYSPAENTFTTSV